MEKRQTSHHHNLHQMCVCSAVSGALCSTLPWKHARDCGTACPVLKEISSGISDLDVSGENEVSVSLKRSQAVAVPNDLLRS